MSLVFVGYFYAGFTVLRDYTFAIYRVGNIRTTDDPCVIIAMLSNHLMNFITDYCWATAMLLTLLTVTVRLSIAIPSAVLVIDPSLQSIF